MITNNCTPVKLTNNNNLIHNKPVKPYFTGKHDVPTYVVVDIFDKKIVDVDGDNVDDLSHGDFIKSLIKAHNANVVDVHIDNENGKRGDLVFIAEKFRELAEQIRTKKLKVDAVNFSYFCNAKISSMSALIDSRVTKKNLSKGKIQKQILEALPHSAYKYYKETSDLIKAIEEVTAQGVPVYVCGGHHGSSCFNMLTLGKGIIGVGSVDVNGVKRAFTGDNSLIKRWAQGVFNVAPVKDKNNNVLGYDVTGTGKVEIPVNKTSGGISNFVKDFYSKPLDTLFADEYYYERMKVHAKTITSPEYSPALTDYNFMINHLDVKQLFDIDRVAEILKIDPKRVEALKQSGDYTNYSFTMAYKADKKNNKITNIDYDRTGRPSINIILGSSYATPMAMIEDNEKRNKGLIAAFKKLFS
ncbi:MAG: hypothetical protein AB7V50_04370 [Vampirovibrionia bacterium]